MSVSLPSPSPSHLKKLHDAKRASESTPPADASDQRATSESTGRGPRNPSNEKTKSSTPSASTGGGTARRKPVWGKRPEHLMDRPLRDHQGLQVLRSQLGEPVKKDTRKPRRAQRP